MIDCEACGGKGAELTNRQGPCWRQDSQRVKVCEGDVVRRGLVDDNQLTGKCCLIVRIVNTAHMY